MPCTTLEHYTWVRAGVLSGCWLPESEGTVTARTAILKQREMLRLGSNAAGGHAGGEHFGMLC